MTILAQGCTQTGQPRHVETSNYYPHPVHSDPLPSPHPASLTERDLAPPSSGFTFTLRTVDREHLEEHLLTSNTDPTVDGIIVYYPIFNSRQDQYLQQIVSVSKDVEGLSHRYIFNMYQNIRFLDDAQLQKSILPCTPLATIKILEHLHVYNPILPHGNRLFGHTVTVINRSEVVGRPLAALLANDGARVYSVDVTGVQEFSRGEGIQKKRHEVVDKAGWGLEDVLPLSDVVISGVPGEGFSVPVERLREGAVCVNFSSEKNFPPEVKRKASIYVPAIGKVTIVVLLRNLLVSRMDLSFPALPACCRLPLGDVLKVLAWLSESCIIERDRLDRMVRLW